MKANSDIENYNTPSEDGRAWVEIDLDALAYNASTIQAYLPQGCELMSIVKTDAYGHGVEKCAARLRREGFKVFAVSTVNEGVRLRENGLDGEILVLGYTHAKDARFLNEHSLSQLVVDGAHAKSLDDTGYELRVHIGIDTGMHRLGIEPCKFSEIERVYACKNLIVEGVATHLSSADSRDEDDVAFTNKQIESYISVVDKLRERGYNTGKLHAQASYGIFNYPGFTCDYARAGIALYGAMSDVRDRLDMPSLRPVLSLRAIIAQVRTIGAMESVSYGRIYTTDKPIKLATVSIGYADGVPRQMSGNGGVCLVGGRRVPIVGRVCMDMLMLDVSGVENVGAEDVVTLIGKDGNEEIRCEDFAAVSGTITNDILCRLGSRLPRVYIDLVNAD